MRTTAILATLLCVSFVGCGRNNSNQGSAQGTSGSGAVYGRGGASRDDAGTPTTARRGAERGKDDQQRAAENATDMRPRGGSMQGAGGAGPGYDGSGQGTGKHGTVSTAGSGVGAGLNTSANVTNNNSGVQTNTVPQTR